MTIIPETRFIYWKIPLINIKVDEKIMLKTIKTRLNPEIKLIVLAIGLGLYSVPGGELPIIHRYEGISGNTQGDRKESSPAPNAIKIDIFSIIYFYYYFIVKFTIVNSAAGSSYGGAYVFYQFPKLYRKAG